MIEDHLGTSSFQAVRFRKTRSTRFRSNYVDTVVNRILHILLSSAYLVVKIGYLHFTSSLHPHFLFISTSTYFLFKLLFLQLDLVVQVGNSFHTVHGPIDQTNNDRYLWRRNIVW